MTQRAKYLSFDRITTRNTRKASQVSLPALPLSRAQVCAHMRVRACSHKHIHTTQHFIEVQLTYNKLQNHRHNLGHKPFYQLSFIRVILRVVHNISTPEGVQDSARASTRISPELRCKLFGYKIQGEWLVTPALPPSFLNKGS